MNITSFFMVSLHIISTEYHHVGCFKIHSGPLTPSLEGTDQVLNGNYATRVNSLDKCLNAARRKGNKMFALKHGGDCLSSPGEHSDFIKSYTEKSTKCRNSKGGADSMNIYLIKGA